MLVQKILETLFFNVLTLYTGIAAVTYLLIKDRGVKLHYVEAGDTSMPLLLCLHGFPECWFSWRHQLKEFSSQFRVVAVDLRGYGDSDKTKRVSDYSFSETVEDIKSFIQELEPVDGKCSLMGHDWGGTLAWKFVEKYPHLIHRHISINSPHSDVMAQLLKSNFSQLKKFWCVYMIFFSVLNI
ncbi:Epoxide hydrolase 4, partial [Armadillidium nasatum]